MIKSLWLSVPLVSVILCASCTATSHTAFRLKPIEAAKTVIAIDAKQRAILVADVPLPKAGPADTQVRTSARFCSEPSPDVYSVIAQALTVGGSFGKSADPASMQAALNAAFSSAEQGTTIPRTQTINMLRELMFRTCERFLSGGYEPEELSIQAIRDQRLMVSILAIEQLTGAVTPKPAAVGATASASQNGAEAIVRLDDARKELDASGAAATKAQKAYDGQNKDDTCKKIDEAVKNGTELDEAQKTAQPKCQSLGTGLSASKQRLALATEHHADLQRLSSGSGGTTATQTDYSKDSGLSHVDMSAVKDVAMVVKGIVDSNYLDSTEVLLFCLRSLRNVAKSKSDVAAFARLSDEEKTRSNNLGTSCSDFITAFMEAATVRVEAGAAQYQELADAAKSRRNADSVVSSLFDAAWSSLHSRLSSDEGTAKLVADLKKSLTSDEERFATCFKKEMKKEDAAQCFKDLRPSIQRKLARE
jgi:hypothetical protein